jgi:hypothetical protein
MTDHAEERHQLEAALERLLSGAPIRSSGQFTIVALAQESQIKRARIYEQYPDLVAAFRARAGNIPPPPALQALRGEVDTVRAKNKELVAENCQLRDRIRTLSAVIAELTHQSDVNNVVPLRS